MCAATPDLSAALDAVIEFFLKSHDFNGIPLSRLPVPNARAAAIELVRGGKADAVFTNNPHVKHCGARKHFHAEPIDEQVQKLDAAAQLSFVCPYPSPAVLAQVVDRSLYDGRPFTLRLALGDGQLEFRAFDLMVLEHYRNDPRYHYRSDDVSGSIGVTDESESIEVQSEQDFSSRGHVPEAGPMSSGRGGRNGDRPLAIPS